MNPLNLLADIAQNSSRHSHSLVPSKPTVAIAETLGAINSIAYESPLDYNQHCFKELRLLSDEGRIVCRELVEKEIAILTNQLNDYENEIDQLRERIAESSKLELQLSNKVKELILMKEMHQKSISDEKENLIYLKTTTGNYAQETKNINIYVDQTKINLPTISYFSAVLMNIEIQTNLLKRLEKQIMDEEIAIQTKEREIDQMKADLLLLKQTQGLDHSASIINFKSTVEKIKTSLRWREEEKKALNV